MKAYSFNEILKKVTEEVGISLETLSICCDIPIDSLKDASFSSKQMNFEKADYILLIMCLILNSRPVGREDEYVLAVIESLEDHFKISHKVIAQYAGVTLPEFHAYLEKPDSISIALKYQIATAVLHLFGVLIRKPKI